jgi:uncharacterized protein YyaL (SSP411 family)
MASDYAAMMRASLALAEASPPAEATRLCGLAVAFAAALETHHRDGGTGYLATAADDAADVVIRARPTTDDAVPNAHGLYAQALLKLASLTGETAWRARADALLAGLASAIAANPYGHASLLNAIDQRLRGIDIVILGEESAALREAALAAPFLDRSVRIAGSDAGAELPEIAGYRGALPAAFICAEGRCSLPATRPEDIAARIASLRG